MTAAERWIATDDQIRAAAEWLVRAGDIGTAEKARDFVEAAVDYHRRHITWGEPGRTMAFYVWIDKRRKVEIDAATVRIDGSVIWEANREATAELYAIV